MHVCVCIKMWNFDIGWNLEQRQIMNIYEMALIQVKL